MKIVVSLSIVVIVIAGFLYFALSAEAPDNNSETAKLLDKSDTEREAAIQNAESSVLDAKLLIGDSSALVTVVEYFDYKCPNCNTFHRTIKPELQAKYGEDRINFELRATPIIGPDSARAARGAYCSAEQGLFNEYHDLVMNYMWDNYYKSGNFAAEFEDILTEQEILTITETLALDEASFSQCLSSLKYNPALDRDLLAAADDGVRGTPGFVIGEQSFVGTQPLSVFEALIEAQE